MLHDSPSRRDGLSDAEERRLRRAGCALITRMSRKLYGTNRSRAPTVAAYVLFNRFFALQSFAQHDLWVSLSLQPFLSLPVGSFLSFRANFRLYRS